MPSRSQRPILNKLLGLQPLEVGRAKYVTIDDAVAAMGTDFSAEQLSAALDAQQEIEVTVTTLYRWRREIA